jgi:hypothetical protein
MGNYPESRRSVKDSYKFNQGYNGFRSSPEFDNPESGFGNQSSLSDSRNQTLECPVGICWNQFPNPILETSLEKRFPKSPIETGT